MRAVRSYPPLCLPCKQGERRYSQAKYGSDSRRKAWSDSVRRTRGGTWQVVRLGRCSQQKECVQMAQAACRAGRTGCTVDIGVGHATTMQVCFAPPGAFVELTQLSELDGVRWASLGTGR